MRTMQQRIRMRQEVTDAEAVRQGRHRLQLAIGHPLDEVARAPRIAVLQQQLHRFQGDAFQAGAEARVLVLRSVIAFSPWNQFMESAMQKAFPVGPHSE